LADQHRGIKDLKRLPEVIVVVDANHEITAVREARLLEIPVIGIVDTNTNPNSVDYPIPANDDSIRTIQLIISAISDEILTTASGKEKAPEETPANVEQKLPEEQVEAAEVNVAAEQETETETVDAANEDVTADQASEEVAAAETGAEEESEEVKETTEDAEVI
jgi:ribosomal protein S2